MPFPPILTRDFYQRTTEDVAMDLLGKVLVRRDSDGIVRVRLTEVEAYLGVEDPACHTYRGRRTARTETMWGDAGFAYVYLVYGIHHCLNVVTMGPGDPQAVLLRGGVVEEGALLVRERRGRGVARRALTDGPGKLCQALAITRIDDGVDLTQDNSSVTICDDGARIDQACVQRLPRVGVEYASEAAAWPLRFVAESPSG
ncbi:MAG: DNA-3-methyladenine glycosylase [Holophagae bacterium]